MLLNPFTFHSPRSLHEATSLMASLEHARLLAGGTFLINNLKMLKKKGIKTPEHIISLKNIEELKEITDRKEKLIIGAMATMRDLIDAPSLKDHLIVLKDAAKNIATTPIRNMATVGGNLTCRYTWTEMPAIMVGLGAALCFLGNDGTEETIAAEDFFAAGAKSHKLLVRVAIPKVKTMRAVYGRVKKSPQIDIPLLSLMITTVADGKKFTGTRVAVNNGTAFAQRDRALEAFLDGKKMGKGLADEAPGHLTQEICGARSSDYKKHMFRVCLKTVLADIMGAQ